MNESLCLELFFLACGIVLSHCLFYPATGDADKALLYTFVAFLTIAAAYCIVYRLTRYRSKPAKRGFIVLMPILFVAIGALFYTNQLAKRYIADTQDKSLFHGIVTSPPNHSGRRTTLDIQTLDERRLTLRISIWSDEAEGAWFNSDSILGREVAGQAVVRRPVNRGNPDEFDYALYLWTQGVSGVANVTPDDIWPVKPTGLRPNLLTRVRIAALRLRGKMLQRYASAGLGGETLAIVSAMTLGDRSLLTPAIRELYAESGASHLLALSGMHLGIIIGIMLTLAMTRFVISPIRFPLLATTLVLAWTFALVAGLPTSLLRACLMTTLCIFGFLLQRFCEPMQYLVSTAFLMLLFDPTTLFDVGAQLSFAAVAGIIVVYQRAHNAMYNHCRHLVYRLKRLHLFGALDALLVSLSAQLFTLPLVAYHFNRIPLYAPVFSVILVPLTATIIYTAFLLLLASLVSATLTGWIAWLLPHMVGIQVTTMQFAVSLPGASIKDFWSQRAEPQVVVYNNRRCPAMHIIASPDRSYLLAPWPDSTATGLAQIANTFWVRRLTAPPKLLETNAVSVSDMKIMMLASKADIPTHPAPDAPVTDIDVLWICGDFRGSLFDVAAAIRPRVVVLSESLPRWLRMNLRSEAEQLRSEAERLHTNTERLRSEADHLRSETEHLRSEADHLRSETEQLRSETEQPRSETASPFWTTYDVQEQGALRLQIPNDPRSRGPTIN